MNTPEIMFGELEKRGFRRREGGEPLKGGNNRLYCAYKEGVQGVVKFYFRHPSDKRDRQRHEWEFSHYLWENGIRQIPEPLEMDREAGWSFFSHVQGVRPLKVGKEEVDQAKEFLLTINRFRFSSKSDSLLTACEGGFLISDQIEGIQKRIERLLNIGEESRLHQEVKSRITNSVLPQFLEKVKLAQERYCTEEWHQFLEKNERILSPSDFGFHNSLKRDNGAISFLDFEYAGWDDPVKCLSDFFYQPAIPVEEHYFDRFATELVEGLGLSERIWKRLEILRPFYRMKWGCILLNEFLPEVRSRRTEAAGEITEEQLICQWEKAKSYLGLLT